MFQGSIPPNMRSYVAETVRSWGVKSVWNPCAGNMTIARTLPDLDNHANDVTLYTSALGWWATGEEMPFTIKPEAEAEIGWMQATFKDRDDILASIMLATRFFDLLGKDNAYARRETAAWREQWTTLHAKTVENVRKSAFKLASYGCKDATEWLTDDVPADAAVVSFPPFFGGGYERMWKALDERIAWPAPTYPEMGEAEIDHMMHLMMDRDRWCIGLHEPREELKPYLKGVMGTTLRGYAIHLYSSEGPRRTETPRQKLEPVKGKRLTKDDTLIRMDEVTLHTLTTGQFNSLRSQHLDPEIAPAAPAVALGIAVGGKLAGCLGFNQPDSKFDAHTVYMLSDFPVAPTRYKRLAALIARCAQSEEVQMVLERTFSRRVKSLATTAFTNNQVSMKYRNAGLKLTKRTKTDDGPHALQLQYEAPAGRFTLQKAYADWWDKNGGKVDDHG